jgi:hypothetical protein
MTDSHDLCNEHQAQRMFDVCTAQKVMINTVTFLQLHVAPLLLLLLNSTCHMAQGGSISHVPVS